MTAEARDAFIQLVARQVIENLGEDTTSGMHPGLLPNGTATARQASKTPVSIQIEKGNTARSTPIQHSFLDAIFR